MLINGTFTSHQVAPGNDSITVRWQRAEICADLSSLCVWGAATLTLCYAKQDSKPDLRLFYSFFFKLTTLVKISLNQIRAAALWIRPFWSKSNHFVSCLRLAKRADKWPASRGLMWLCSSHLSRWIQEYWLVTRKHYFHIKSKSINPQMASCCQ